MAGVVAAVVDLAVGTYPILYTIVLLGLLLPALAAQVRRLHDTDRTGWWLLISFVPLIGTIWLIILYLRASDPGPNRYGPPPGQSMATA